MREYRGKRKDNGEWTVGYLVKDESGEVNIVNNYGTSYSWDEVDPETVGQYTGCLDFYDGDIARSPGGAIGIITWHDSWCGFYFKTVLGHNEYDELVPMMASVPLYNDLPKYTKLGNRWDNLDLLGEVRGNG